MPRSMAVKQEPVDGLTTPRNKACSFRRASKKFFQGSRMYIAVWRFRETRVCIMDRSYISFKDCGLEYW